MNKNIEYYNENAEEFYNSTVNTDMSNLYADFLSRILPGGVILDAGCGSGRDSKYFLEHGFEVVAFDASSEMCNRASKLLNRKVLNLRFDEIDFENCFDGIWACASLLHVPPADMSDTLLKLKKSLKKNGIFYASFKSGIGVTDKVSRSFTNYDEKSIKELFNEAGFEVLDIKSTHDNRPGREEEAWTNIIVRNTERIKDINER